MTTITLIASSPTSLAVKRFTDKADANTFAGRASAVKGADVIQLTRPDQLKKLSEKRLAELFNTTLGKGDKRLVRMQKTPATFKRIFEALNGATTPTPNTKKKEAMVQEESSVAVTTKRGKKTAKAEGTVSPSRRSEFTGKKLIKLTDTNPRRAGSHGAKSWDAYRSGTLYETAVANGARPRDILWDINVGQHVKAE